MRVELKNVSKSYDKAYALDHVSLVVEPGTVLACLGINGAGKTTLLRLLATLSIPMSGTIEFDGEPLLRERLDLRRRLAFLADFPLFPNPGLTVLEYLCLVLKIYEVDPAEAEPRAIDLLRNFDLLPLAEARLATLSRGQAYKAGLAPLLAVEPELLMLDEPFASGMDPRGLESLRQQMREAARKERTVIFTTQILEIAASAADRIVVLNRGRVDFDAWVSDLRRQGNVEETLRQLFVNNEAAAPHVF